MLGFGRCCAVQKPAGVGMVWRWAWACGGGARLQESVSVCAASTNRDFSFRVQYIRVRAMHGAAAAMSATDNEDINKRLVEECMMRLCCQQSRPKKLVSNQTKAKGSINIRLISVQGDWMSKIQGKGIFGTLDIKFPKHM